MIDVDTFQFIMIVATPLVAALVVHTITMNAIRRTMKKIRSRHLYVLEFISYIMNGCLLDGEQDLDRARRILKTIHKEIDELKADYIKQYKENPFKKI